LPVPVADVAAAIEVPALIVGIRADQAAGRRLGGDGGVEGPRVAAIGIHDPDLTAAGPSRGSSFKTNEHDPSITGPLRVARAAITGQGADVRPVRRDREDVGVDVRARGAEDDPRSVSRPPRVLESPRARRRDPSKVTSIDGDREQGRATVAIRLRSQPTVGEDQVRPIGRPAGHPALAVAGPQASGGRGQRRRVEPRDLSARDVEDGGRRREARAVGRDRAALAVIGRDHLGTSDLCPLRRPVRGDRGDTATDAAVVEP